MDKLRIAIVEDEMVVAQLLIDLLEEAGYEAMEPAITYGEAIEMLETEAPDLVLLDVSLAGTKDGIDVAGFINKTLGIPFIFLTANSDRATLDRVKEVNPMAFLVKPFKPVDLVTSIELALHTFNNRKPVLPEARKELDALFVKHRNGFHKVLFTEIAYMKSELNYVEIHTLDGKQYLHRATLSELIERVPANQMLRVHRSYLVSVANVNQVFSDYVIVGASKVPVSKTHRQVLREALNLL